MDDPDEFSTPIGRGMEPSDAPALPGRDGHGDHDHGLLPTADPLAGRARDQSDELVHHVIHVAGLDVQVGSIRRQRCAWCGALIQEDDLARMGWMLNEDGSDPGPPPMWQVGALIGTNKIDGTGATWVVDHQAGDVLPDGCCAKLDPAATA